MKRYKPGLTSTQKPWPHLDVKIVEASMVECEDGGYVEHSPMLDAAPEMYAMLEKAKTLIEDYDYDCFCSRGSGEWSEPESAIEIEKLLAKARSEL